MKYIWEVVDIIEGRTIRKPKTESLAIIARPIVGYERFLIDLKTGIVEEFQDKFHLVGYLNTSQYEPLTK